MREMIVDSFAGGGGASTGIEMALGISPDIAINHDAVALNMHAANHPGTRHLPHSIWKVDPRGVCDGRPVGLLWASPDCKHFSKAKGGRPVDRSIRDLAWVVVRWARQVSPRVIILENVEEFQTWGPLGGDGRPCADRKGVTFRRWVGQLRRLGYRVDFRELRACDYGTPTIRKRLFLIARRDGDAIVWPAPTHGDPKSEAVRSGELLPWRTAAEIIDWALPCPSIFDSSEQIMEKHRLRAVRPLQAATMTRIAKGVKRYVLDAGELFIVNLAHHDDCRAQKIRAPLTTLSAAFLQKYYGVDQDPRLHEPLHTVTTKHHFGVVTVDIDGEPYAITDIGMRMLSPRELFRAQGFADSYIIDRGADGKPITKTDQVAKCGNSVCPPIAQALVAANFAPRDIEARNIPEFYLEAAE